MARRSAAWGITLIAALILAFILNFTYVGRHVYAVGGNEEAARLVGINVAGVKTLLFIISGCLAATAGVLMVARLASGQPTIGANVDAPLIHRPIIGGTAMSGGGGSVFGTIIGAVIWEQVVLGAALAFAILIDRVRTRERNR